MEEILEPHKWLIFEVGTCFGNKTNHFGIIVGIDTERRMAIVAVNATSKLDKLIYFADRNGIPVENALVDVTNVVHFRKPTGLNCHRPQEVSLGTLEKWVDKGLVRKAPNNGDVNETIMKELVRIMLASPLVTEAQKIVIRNSNRI